jgi:hypothetical protein
MKELFNERHDVVSLAAVVFDISGLKRSDDARRTNACSLF